MRWHIYNRATQLADVHPPTPTKLSDSLRKVFIPLEDGYLGIMIDPISRQSMVCDVPDDVAPASHGGYPSSIPSTHMRLTYSPCAQKHGLRHDTEKVATFHQSNILRSFPLLER